MSQTDLEVCLRKVGPIPSSWVRRYFGPEAATKRNASGLCWPIPRSSRGGWARRCEDPEQTWLAWALWAGLHAQKLDSPRILVGADVHLQRTGGIGTVAGLRFGMAKQPTIDVPMRLGNQDDGWTTPGPTIQEEIHAYRQAGGHGLFLPTPFEFDPYDVGGSDLGVILDIEARRASGWIAANEVLGMTCLLGPLPRRAFVTAKALRKRNYLDATGALTKSGWWRLAVTARQGVGHSEWYRARRLGAVTRSRHHMRRIQLYCLQQWRERGWLPIGVEYSEFSWALSRLPNRYRPDALLLTPENELVWFELMRRPLTRVSAYGAVKYVNLPEEYLPMLTRLIHRPIRFVYLGPERQFEQLIRRPHIEI